MCYVMDTRVPRFTRHSQRASGRHVCKMPDTKFSRIIIWEFPKSVANDSSCAEIGFVYSRGILSSPRVRVSTGFRLNEHKLDFPSTTRDPHPERTSGLSHSWRDVERQKIRKLGACSTVVVIVGGSEDDVEWLENPSKRL